MNITNWFGFTLSCIIIIICILAAVYIFYTKILYQYKRKVAFDSASDIIDAINLISKLEIQVYEENRFRSAGPKLNTDTFKAYYKELCTTILNNFSADFFIRASMYFTEDAITNMVSEIVRNYLTTKLGVVQSTDEAL